VALCAPLFNILTGRLSDAEGFNHSFSLVRSLAGAKTKFRRRTDMSDLSCFIYIYARSGALLHFCLTRGNKYRPIIRENLISDPRARIVINRR
jgi:hypothetical protein